VGATRTTDADRDAVERALTQAGVEHFRGRSLGTLSGGERQRVWVALALAQEPDVLLMDEPTTFLDIGHQLDLLQLLAELNHARGLTVLMVMHDVGLAAQVARRLIALNGGHVVADGTPSEVVTVGRLQRIFGVALRVYHDPETGAPGILPAARTFAPPGG
jgi:iron complex transport system ATP-binding protein